MPALDFPNSPTIGQLYPDPAMTGTPTYQWDGTAWISANPFGELILSGDPGAITGLLIGFFVVTTFAASNVTAGTAVLYGIRK